MASGISSLDASVNNSIFRKDHPMILACLRHLAWIGPARMVFQVGGYAAGTVIGKVTSSGFFAAYNDSNSDGTQTAVGILFDDCTPASGDTEVTRAILGGKVYQAKLTGLDAAAIVDLKARSVTASDGAQILSF